jgi:hypothetical protein
LRYVSLTDRRARDWPHHGAWERLEDEHLPADGQACQYLLASVHEVLEAQSLADEVYVVYRNAGESRAGEGLRATSRLSLRRTSSHQLDIAA